MEGTSVISVDVLGICEECRVPFSFEGFNLIDLIGKAECGHCRSILTAASIGVESVGVGCLYNKIRWVSPNGDWTFVRPRKPFNLRSWLIVPRQASKATLRVVGGLDSDPFPLPESQVSEGSLISNDPPLIFDDSDGM